MIRKATRLAPDPAVSAAWGRLADTLAARLRSADRTVRGLTSWIAQSAWRQRYYADQPNMLRSEDLDPGLDDVIDALRLMPAVRYAVEVDERDLIAAARHLGASWEAIGVALGAKASGARQTARGRYKRLGGNVNDAVAGKAAEQAPVLVAVERAETPGRVVEAVRTDPPIRDEERPYLVPPLTGAPMFVEPTLLDGGPVGEQQC